MQVGSGGGRWNGRGNGYSGWVGGICRSIWLNRNGGGDIFKPGKVWCLGGRGRVSGVPRISLHYLTIRWQLYRFEVSRTEPRGRQRQREKEGERERERERFPIVLERTVLLSSSLPSFVPLARRRSESSITWRETTETGVNPLFPSSSSMCSEIDNE